MSSRRTVLPSVFTLVLAALLLASCAVVPPLPPTAAGRPGGGDAQQRFAAEVNAYRARHGQPRIAVSRSLMAVARAHLDDLERRHRRGTRCNMHSWSTAGPWSACCYTPDHAAAECMWNKPREITRGLYTAPGYEIVAHYTDPITPARALEIWRESPAHHAMLLNTGRWADNPWRALGAAIGEHYAVVWFAEEPDAVGG